MQKALEFDGRAAKRGLWRLPRPIPRWEWRRGGKGSHDAAAAGQVVGNRDSNVYHAPTCNSVARMKH